MKRLTILLGLLCGSHALAAPARPNIVVILADDLGYGDVRCYNPDRGKIPTPNLDHLAAQGMRFTDAHSSSGVCSPSRYTLLTGRYHWRTRLQAGIVNVFGPPLIAKDRLTLAGLLRKDGYQTACVGKWHLGWDWPIPEGKRALFHVPRGGKADPPDDAQKTLWKEVFSQPIPGGPTTRGFDTYFGTDVPNWPPYCFIENDRTVGVPSELLPAPMLINQLASLGGPALPGWSLEAILPTLGERACQVIHRAAKEPKPFFLYLPLTAPHTPLAVSKPWQGKSGLGAYGDLVMQTDAFVGQVLEALEKSGAAKHTLVVFTSDNGCAPVAGIAAMQKKGHHPSGPLRGHKADVYEGGHRVPFVVRWPGVVPAGKRCDQFVMQADLMATFAELLGVKLPDNAGEDSVSLLSLLKGKDRPVRDIAVQQSSQGLLAVRKGTWKLIAGPGSGGGGKSGTGTAQLYHLGDDLGETKDLSSEKPAVVAELLSLLEKIVTDGRSRPGPKRANDVRVNWRRFLKEDAAPSTTLRYVRPSKDRFELESLVTHTRTKGGVTYTSLTDRGSEKMTLTIRFDGKDQVLGAEAVRETAKGKQTATAVFKDNEVTLTRQGKTERLAASPDVVVTTAPDWSDIFQVVRRYDRARGGKQTFAGLWIHPVQDARRLTFTVEPEKDEAVEVEGKKLALKRYRVVLRSGAYLVWADQAGRVYRLMPPGRPGSAVILEGFEKAASGLR